VIEELLINSRVKFQFVKKKKDRISATSWFILWLIAVKWVETGRYKELCWSCSISLMVLVVMTGLRFVFNFSFCMVIFFTDVIRETFIDDYTF
jgi:hypothetical protein